MSGTVPLAESNSSETSMSSEDKLRAQYTEIAVLAGRLAHEIKNPLSTIGLNMELLAEEFDGAESPRDRRALSKIAVVQRECQRLQNILDDFLNFARARPSRLETCDLNLLVKELLDFQMPQMREVGIEAVQLLDSDLPLVRIDREQVQAALLNLVINAQQSMPEGGQLTVRTHQDGETVVLDLIDTGCGMDDKTKSQIFDTFFSTKHGGSGLGLPTTRKILEAHNGTIDVQSEPGRGTQFTLVLPAYNPPEDAGEESPTEAPAE